MTRAASLALRGLALLLFIGPVVRTGILLSRDVRDAPLKVLAGADGGARSPIGPLQPGARHVVRLAEGAQPFGGLLIYPATWHSRPVVRLQVCAGERCEASEKSVEDNQPLALAVPRGLRGGEVTLVVDSIREGAFGFWGHEGRPAVEAVFERSWSPPLDKARAYFDSAVGVGTFEWVLGFNAVLTGVLVALACWRAWWRPPEHDSGPGAPARQKL
ncbi:hypothetical protein ACLESO_13170 [Pyxidicoccus sp. 3LG]